MLCIWKKAPFEQVCRQLLLFFVQYTAKVAMVLLHGESTHPVATVTKVHDHSAGLLADFSPLQIERRNWQPELPCVLKSAVQAVPDDSAASLSSPADSESLAKLFPHTSQQKYVRLEPSSNSSAWESHPPLRVGVVLSGGQAPGGHNIISGLFDYVKQCNPNSQLFGFLGGPHGIFTAKYREIDAEFMSRYRNLGGFDMICSGRHKIETDEQKSASLQVCKKLDLHGLVVTGGDDSNTNAAILAEYFKSVGSSTLVIGCPKTIDGDLKNDYVETSFGFDTAIKTYSELIGNLCIDVATSQNRYHFVRLMGRSASNIALECALQTRPNLCFIGEEVQQQNRSLQSLVDELVDLVEKRAAEGKRYGIILLPEGLIEFIPEVGQCIREINDIVAHQEFDALKLSTANKAVFDSLPESIRTELLLERDPHGNVQVARIATEKLLILMTHAALEKKGKADIFRPTAHYFGYEGRCAMPSNFDANYCYALGHTAGALVDLGLTGYMAVARDLHLPASQWKAAGCPLQSMMNIERRKGKEVPVIKKYLVELEKPMFQMFCRVREAWKLGDFYRNPGPIQFKGPCSNITNFSITAPTEHDLLPPLPFNVTKFKNRYNFIKSEAYLSPLQRERLHATINVSPLLTKPRAKAVPGPRCPIYDQQGQKFVNRAFPLQCMRNKMRIFNIVDESFEAAETPSHGLRVGVVLQGQQAPGSANILHGIFERLKLIGSGGVLIGFKGITGLLEGNFIEISHEDLKLHFNQGGFELLGRTKATKAAMRTESGLNKVLKTCQELNLDGLVMIGGQTSLTDAVLVSEHFLSNGCKTAVVGVPATQENNLRHSLIEACVGFDSTSKCYSSLIGNLLTDAASATKYWYFVRLMGQVPSHMVLEAAFQTHPNMTIISEKYFEADQSIFDVVKDIADVIAERADRGKNFGTILIPEGLVSQLPNLRQLLSELSTILRSTAESDFVKLRTDLVDCLETPGSRFIELAPWLQAMLKSLPLFFRIQLVQKSQIELSEVPTELLLSHMVELELAARKQRGLYSGAFSPVCHYLGFQGRSTMPSEFDCRLGLAHGYLSCIAVEAQLTGYVTSIRGLCGHPSTWKFSAVPIAAIMKVMPEREMSLYGREVPMVPCAEVDLQGKPYLAFDSASEQWEMEDHFCNPGPIQFGGVAAHFHNRTLFEEQHGYLEMLGQVYLLVEIIYNLLIL